MAASSNPFYRLPGTRENGDGVGLGLALVRQTARRHAGDVNCNPRAGGGGEFGVVPAERQWPPTAGTLWCCYLAGRVATTQASISRSADAVAERRPATAPAASNVGAGASATKVLRAISA